MDKTQATELILTRLRTGHKLEEIADELGRLLKAPMDVTKPFVDQIAASHPEAVSLPPVAKGEMTEGLGDISTEVKPEMGTSSPVANPLIASNSDLPPGLQALINEQASITNTNEPATSFEQAPISTEPLPRQAKFVPPAKKSENLENEASSSKNDLDDLRAEVLRQLKKQKRFNDIVEFVCDKTGWHWNKSQRFVARVKTKHHDELMSGQNRATMIIGIGIILVGLVMTLNGASVISEYAKLAVFARTNPEELFAMSPQEIIFALMATVTGFGMIIGGGYGIGRALTDH